jgi:hypothetical protein
MPEQLSRRDVLRVEALRLATQGQSTNNVIKFNALADSYFEWLILDDANPEKKKLGRPPKTLV